MRVLRLIAVTGALVGLLAFPGPERVNAAVPGLTFTQTGCEGHSDSIARLYTAGLGRVPDRGGFDYWLGEYTGGRWSLPRMATFFTQSTEFTALYGTLSQDGFIRQLYRNVLGREGEEGGVAFWNAQMSSGVDRGTILLRFAESPENIINSGTSQPTLGPFNNGLSTGWTCPAVGLQGPAGPAGPAGPQGEQGPTGGSHNGPVIIYQSASMPVAAGNDWQFCTTDSPHVAGVEQTAVISASASFGLVDPSRKVWLSLQHSPDGGVTWIHIGDDGLWGNEHISLNHVLDISPNSEHLFRLRLRSNHPTTNVGTVKCQMTAVIYDKAPAVAPE